MTLKLKLLRSPRLFPSFYWTYHISDIVRVCLWNEWIFRRSSSVLHRIYHCLPGFPIIVLTPTQALVCDKQEMDSIGISGGKWLTLPRSTSAHLYLSKRKVFP